MAKEHQDRVDDSDSEHEHEQERTTRYSLDPKPNGPILSVKWLRQELDKDPQGLYEQIKDQILRERTMTNQVKEYKAETISQRAHIVELTEELDQLQLEKQHLERELLDALRQQRQETPDRQEASRAIKRSAKMNDPKPLTGDFDKMGLSFETWLIKIKAKMRANRDHFATEDDRITHVASLIEGDAADLIAPRLDPSSFRYYKDVDEFYSHLTTLYGDVNKKRNARAEYRRLYMKKDQSFQEFYARFLRLIVDAETPEDDLKEDLNEKLQLELQAAVSTYFNDDNIDTETFAHWCTTIDQQNKQRQTKIARFSNNKTKTTPAFASNPTPSKTTSTAKYTPVTTTTMPRLYDSNSRDTTPRFTRPIYNEPEKQELSKQGRCFICKELGHIANACSHRRAIVKIAELKPTEQEDQGKDSP
jgi:regulator of replication initiation timing